MKSVRIRDEAPEEEDQRKGAKKPPGPLEQLQKQQLDEVLNACYTTLGQANKY